MRFNVIRHISLRLKDMATVKNLCLKAEEYAHKNGEDKPGAEHFLLSAFDLPDGTARRVFETAGANPDEFEKAVKHQYSEALDSVGIDTSQFDLDDTNVEIPSGLLYQSQPSAQNLMKELVELRRQDKDIPLLGLHVIEVLSSKEHGVVARSLKAMGLRRSSLKKAVKQELETYSISLLSHK